MMQDYIFGITIFSVHVLAQRKKKQKHKWDLLNISNILLGSKLKKILVAFLIFQVVLYRLLKSISQFCFSVSWVKEPLSTAGVPKLFLLAKPFDVKNI